jgi:hypothetical protein
MDKDTTPPQMPYQLECRGRVPLDRNSPFLRGGSAQGKLDARLQSFDPETGEVVLRLDARHNQEFWAEPFFTLAQLADFLLEEEGIELKWSRAARHTYETEPCTIRLENGTQIQTVRIKNRADVNVSEYTT